MVSGRAGYGLVDSLFEHGLTPASTISNIIVFCHTQKKLEELKKEFGNKYKPSPISIDFIMFDAERKYLDSIKSKIVDCLNSTHAKKMKELPDFNNDLPSSNA